MPEAAPFNSTGTLVRTNKTKDLLSAEAVERRFFKAGYFRLKCSVVFKMRLCQWGRACSMLVERGNHECGTQGLFPACLSGERASDAAEH